MQGIEQAVVRIGLDRELVPPGLLAAHLGVVPADLERDRDAVARAHREGIRGVEHLAEITGLRHQYFRSIGT
jgi:hypothetical protein